MGNNKKWKRKAKKILGESVKGCGDCRFYIYDPYEYEHDCELSHWIDSDECCDLRKVRRIMKGENLEDCCGEKIV